MQMRRHTRNAARKNLAAFGNEFLQEIGILVVNCFQRDVDTAARHRAVGATKGGAAFGRFWLHGDLLRFAVKSVSAQKWIVFLLLQSIRGARTFLISRAHIARDRLTQRFGLRAFEGDNFLRHGELFLRFLSRRLFFFRLATFLLGQSEEGGNRLTNARGLVLFLKL